MTMVMVMLGERAGGKNKKKSTLIKNGSSLYLSFSVLKHSGGMVDAVKPTPYPSSFTHRRGFVVIRECNLQRHTPQTDHSGALLHHYALLIWKLFFFIVNHFHINRPHK
jgi:hypothetical protein